MTYEVFNGALVGAEDDGRRVVGHPALGLRVDADELELPPPATSVSGGSRYSVLRTRSDAPFREERTQ